jgi:hypothetical protein
MKRTFQPGNEKAREAKARLRALCILIARSETPPEVFLVRLRSSLTGVASKLASGRYVITAPRPVTRRSLYVFLHEIAHVRLGHLEQETRKRLKSWQREQEAEDWARDTMRRYGIAVPRKELKRAKDYVAYKRKRSDQAAHRHAWRDFPEGHPWYGKAQICQCGRRRLIDKGGR